MALSRSDSEKLFINGWSHSKFGKLADKSLEDLIVEVARGAIADAKIEASEVDAIFIGNFNGGLSSENFISSYALGVDPEFRFKPATRIENACASGSAAIFSAADAIRSGRIKRALVIGAEKMTHLDGASVTDCLARAAHKGEEYSRGLTFPGVFAEFAQKYFEKFGDRSESLARIAAKNHSNGALNPLAHLQKDLGFEFCNTVSDSNPIIAAPLRKTDCSLVSDGAAAIIMSSEQGDRSVEIVAMAQVNDYLAMSARDPILFEGPKRAFDMALHGAGLAVADLSFAEIHDCFTIAELLTYEAMGLAKSGEGWRVIDEGVSHRDGALPINVSGGLKAKGHPIGATGVSMHVMAAMQLTGEAGALQLAKTNYGAIFNMGGSAVANYVSILK
jgi:acetyl-CoA C-acetyltransferase